MDKSEKINELASALCKAQDLMGGAVKDSKNPFFKSNYADLSSVVQAIKQPFADNGLSYSQFPIYEDKLVGVETILMHSSGQWISNKLLLPMTKQDPQAAGSAITYARRYALQAIAGIPSEDDDGNTATKPASRAPAFTMDETSNNWIQAIKSGTAKLEDIQDINYRNFIKGNL